MKPLNNLGSLLTDLLAARWLGHGRAVECNLACIAGLYGLMLLLPGSGLDSVATFDLAWYGYGQYLAIPLLVKSILTGGGLILNIRGSAYARGFRVTGALIGSVIWIWLVLKFFTVGAFATVGFSFCVFAALFSIRIMAMAGANLPPPGAPGAPGTR